MTTIIPSEVVPDRLQAVFIRGHLRCFSVGLKNSRMSGTQLLKLTSRITGRTYKRGQYKAALDDINKFLEENPV